MKDRLLRNLDWLLRRIGERLNAIEDERLTAIEERLRVIDANLTIANRTAQEQGQVLGLLHDMVRELHSRFIEHSDSTGAEIRRLKAKVGLNGGR